MTHMDIRFVNFVYILACLHTNAGMNGQVGYFIIAHCAKTCHKNDEYMMYAYLFLWRRNKIKKNSSISKSEAELCLSFRTVFHVL
jgi:hypothetical protein